MEEKKLYLIDGTNQVFRAFYAIKSQLTNREGLPTNAVYGLARMLRKLLAEKDPAYIAAAFDLAAPTFRHKEYEQYKANRPEPPEDLSVQFPYARKVCEALGVPVLQQEGFEADDVIGTLARKAGERGLSVVIVASDKDLLQLVDEKISILNPQKEIEEIDSEGVRRVFGAAPEQVIDVIGLWGDSVDNIPGVPGIGEKKAKEIISLYGNVEKAVERAEKLMGFFQSRDRVLAAIEKVESASHDEKKKAEAEFAIKLAEMQEKGDELKDAEKDENFLKKLTGCMRLIETIRKNVDAFIQKPEEAAAKLKTLKKELKEIEKGSAYKAWESLAVNKEKAFISKKLARIDRDAPIGFDLDALRYRGAREEELEQLFTELGFFSLLEEIGKKPVPPEEISYKIMTSTDDLNNLSEKLRKIKKAFLSISETPEGSDNERSLVVSFHIPMENETFAFILSQRKEEPGASPAIERLKNILEDGKIGKIGYDLKDSIILLKKRNIALDGISFDLMLASYLLDPSAEEFSFRRIVENTLREDYAEKEADKKNTALPVEDIIQNCCKRALFAARLHPVLKDRLMKENLEELYETVEIPLIRVLAHMQIAGVKIDVELLRAMSREMETDLEKVSEEIYTLAGEKFNINSPKQLGEILFSRIGLQHGKKTPKSGDFATGMEVLEELSAQHPLPKKILEYRSIAKIKSTYVDALPALIDPVTGRIHTSFNQAGTATGRLSSSDPNLQNIPIRTETGKEIRKAFIPEKGNLFLCADYSQVELRILAHLADDPDMIESFVRGEDIHRTTASKMLGVPYEKVTESYRRFAKTINFGIVYGMSAFRLSKELGISGSEARKFIESYFNRFRRVKEYIDETTEFVQKEGYVTTLFGRVRYFKEIRSKNRMVQQAAIRQAVNTTIQGTAADLIKKAMIAIYGDLGGYKAEMLLQVHDELLFEVPRENADELRDLVKTKMEGVFQLKAPLIVNVAVGENWAESK